MGGISEKGERFRFLGFATQVNCWYSVRLKIEV